MPNREETMGSRSHPDEDDCPGLVHVERASASDSLARTSKASFADHDAEIIGASSCAIRAAYGSRSACRPARRSRTASDANRELSSAS